MIKIQQPLLTLFEQIHKPFLQHLIALLISGLIALLLVGTLLLSEYGAFVTHLPMQAGSASVGMVVEWTISISLSATCRVVLAVGPVIPG